VRVTRLFLFGTNFKMNQTAPESAAFFGTLAAAVTPSSEVILFVIPPFTSLPAVVARREATRSEICIGAQNMHWAADGAYTGEISAQMLTAIGVDFVLLGHAERRGLFHETDDALAKKVPAAIDAGLRVLLCVGETADEKRTGAGPETVARQLKIALHAIEPASLSRIQIAYEPVWSIGKDGTPATPDDIAPVATHLRHTLTDRFGDGGADVPILYGGSVDPKNAGTFVQVPEIDGLFVGRAAWSVDGYRNVLAAALNARGLAMDSTTDN